MKSKIQIRETEFLRTKFVVSIEISKIANQIFQEAICMNTYFPFESSTEFTATQQTLKIFEKLQLKKQPVLQPYFNALPKEPSTSFRE